MKLKVFLTLISIFFIQSVSNILAQNTNIANNSGNYIFCEIYSISFMSSTIYVKMDTGDKKDKIIQDKDTGKDKRFNTLIDALNYMSNDGWEFVQAYSKATPYESIHYLLKKFEVHKE